MSQPTWIQACGHAGFFFFGVVFRGPDSDVSVALHSVTQASISPSGSKRLVGVMLRDVAVANGSLECEVHMVRTEKEKMLAGELYTASSPEIQADQAEARAWLQRFNANIDMPLAERYQLLKDRFANVGVDSMVRPPFFCDYGYNITLGAGVFLNYGCTILDVVTVEIGDMTQIATGVQILTADHPRDPAVRASGLEFGRPIRIGRNVWIGAGAIILPGITIGDNALIGAGSIVTRDVPAGTTAVGNPARILMGETR